MIPYGRQNISEADINAVVEVLKSDWITQGPNIQKFEKTITDYTGANHALAVCNATAALHIACLALGAKAGEVVWTTPNTFLASANCALYSGAEIDFVDTDPKTYNLCPNKLREKLELAKNQNKLPRIVIPVHLSGQSCQMKEIHELSKEYGFSIIEDASHAVGADYLDTKVGSCRYSDITVFSYHPVKIITTGEGGSLTTNSEELFNKLSMLRTHGMTRDPELLEDQTQGPWFYEQQELGFNYRMTDIQAALGASQMTRLDTFIAKRRELAARYNELLKNLPITLPLQHEDSNSSWHLYIIHTKNRKDVFVNLRELGIGANVHYIPVHLQPYYKKNFGFKAGDFPNAENIYEGSISLPLFYDLSFEEQDQVVAALKKSLELSNVQ